MKKLGFSLLALFMLVSVGMSQAQNNSNFGVKAGLNFNKYITDTDFADIESLTGFHVGIFYTIESNNFRVQPGLEFVQRGSKVIPKLMPLTVKQTLNYIDIPLDCSYKIADLNGTAIRLNVSPRLGFCLSGKNKVGDEKESIKIGSDKDSDEVKGVDFGVKFGGSVQFGQIEPYVGYDLGLVNISNGGDEVKNGSFYLGVAFHL
ncbi:MAG: PorT family protein [Prolixibacteraceae bacterium]|jgi:hypothetical protein|nr:PorT family protein [Prolixibacteraceae bacterium]